MTNQRAVSVAACQMGATLLPAGVSYRAWAPTMSALSVIAWRPGEHERRLPMAKESDVFHVVDPDGRAGDVYWYETADGIRLSDVASRFQPQGVHGPSQVIDPNAYRWQTLYWERPTARDQVIYEVHVGTFAPGGTFLAAIGRLDHVISLGATAIQLMPVAEFPGRANWGYDGVNIFAPSCRYGTPDELRALVDAAHMRGLSVILDVVYNHAGPEGSRLKDFAQDYFHHERANTWGSGFNFDGENSARVREFFLQNVAMWLDEYRVDGLRLDATHAMEDESDSHILEEIATLAHDRGAFVIAEDERNPVQLLTESDGTGYHFDAVWSDDFHHSVRVALTGTREAYFKSYEGMSAELARTLERGWTYCGEPFPYWDGRPRGGKCKHLPPSSFVFCIENHDQVGNRAHGERLAHLISVDKYRAASALLCLSPYTPMLFMGQEWAAETPFLFFTDLGGEAGRKVREGRIAEFRKTGINADESTLATMPDPQDPGTYAMSQLNWSEVSVPSHASVFALYQECLRWRRDWLRGEASDRIYWKVVNVDGFIAIRYFPPAKPEWLLIVNLSGGAPVVFTDKLAPPSGRAWLTAFHTLESRFGGTSEAPLAARYYADETLPLLAPAAIVFHSTHAA